MKTCQCISKNGNKCMREVSAKKGDNHKFCWQHQHCEVIFEDKSKISKKEVKTTKSPKISKKEVKITKSSKSQNITENIIDNILLAVTKMNINYFDNLDYVDMMNLCKTNSQFATICDDNVLLRQIIYNRNKYISIPNNFNISGILKDIYSQITKIITDNYRKEEAPRWINYEQFVDDLIRDSVGSLITPLSDDLDLFIEESEETNNYKFIVNIDKNIIAFPYPAILIDTPENDEMFHEFNSEITFSHKFIDYVKDTYLQVSKAAEKEDNHYLIYHAIAALLLTKY